MSMVMFLLGMQNEEKVNQSIKVLMETEGFKQLYINNEESFKKDEDIRYIIGSANAEKTLSSEKRTDKLRSKIIEVINIR